MTQKTALEPSDGKIEDEKDEEREEDENGVDFAVATRFVQPGHSQHGGLHEAARLFKFLVESVEELVALPYLVAQRDGDLLEPLSLVLKALLEVLLAHVPPLGRHVAAVSVAHSVGMQVLSLVECPS